MPTNEAGVLEDESPRFNLATAVNTGTDTISLPYTLTR